MINSENDRLPRPASRGARFLEQITSAVLLHVMATLGWIVFGEYEQAAGWQMVGPWGLIGVTGLLLLALGLASLVTLLQTRKLIRSSPRHGVLWMLRTGDRFKQSYEEG